MEGRRAFVVHVEASGRSTVEDVRTGRRAAVDSLDEIPGRIESWLEASGEEARSALPPESGGAEPESPYSD